MDATPIRERYFAKPFHPFVLHLTDGREIRVPKPESMMISSDEQQVLVVHPNTDLDVIDLTSIRDLDVQQSATSTSNGKNAREDGSLSIVDLRKFMDAKPFAPFVIRLKDGRDIVVHERRLIFAGFTGWHITVTQPSGHVDMFGIEFVEEMRLLGRTGK